MKRLIGHTRRRRVITGTVAALAVAAVVAIFAVPMLFAGDHGIAAAKSSGGSLNANGLVVNSPVQVYGKYYSQWTVANNTDTDQDTLRLRSLKDVVTAGSGTFPSGELIDKVSWYVVSPGAGGTQCYKTLPSDPTDPNSNGTPANGSGTLLDPWRDTGSGGVVYCDIEPGATIRAKGYNVYTAQPADAVSGTISDQANVIATDLCNGPGEGGTGSTGCPTQSIDGFPNAVSASPSASATLQKLDAVTTTDIHNAAHGVVTAVEVGTPVHDYVRVTPTPAGTPLPGTPPDTAAKADLFWFTNFDCTTPAADSTQLTLAPGPGSMWVENDATGFVKAPAAAGLFSFRANFLGTNAYNPSLGACEPLRVVDADIQIAPNGTNRVGDEHEFTGHVNVNDGSGSVNAPDGTTITFTIDSGPGSFVGGVNSCQTAGATGSCSVKITSPTTGVSVVSAHTTVDVAGVSLTRHTNGSAPNSGPAQKTWVNAKISIAPNATNEIGHPHTFTVTLMKDPGTGTFVAAAGETVTVTLTGQNGASPSPAGPFTGTTDANGQFQVTFASATPGQVIGHASSTLAVGGSQPFTVETDGVAPNSGDATKTFVDANIQITPNGTNRINAQHEFTAHVNVNTGNGSFGPAPDGTIVTFTIVSDSASSTPNPPTQCVTAGGTGECTTTITSATTGVTVVAAHTTLSVGGVLLTRDTNGQSGNSGPATKTWVNAKISIAPNATNEVGQPHTFTVTLEKDLGDGTGFHAAVGETVTVTLTGSNGASPSPAGPFTGTTDANGQFDVTFTSPTAGQVTGHASSTLSVGGSAPFTVETDGVAPNSGDAVKTFVDANIQIEADGVNRVGHPHTFTAHVNVDAGGGAGFVNAPDGTVITFTSLDSNGASSTPNAPTSCTTSGGTGSCTTTITSAMTGQTVVSAHTTVSVGGVSLTRHTDGNAPNSGPATKTWVNAFIQITPDATNRVGQPHTFHVQLMKDTGDGTGFHPAQGEHVAVSLTPSNGAVIGAPSGSCTDAGANTDVNGVCDITFSSNSTGKVTGHASSTLSVAGSAPFTVETDGVILNSGNAVKTYVNARISIAPDATNEVGDPHTFTVTLQKDVGDGLGFQPAAGEHVTVTLSDANGASHTAPTGTCTNAGANTDAAGQCTITFTSNSAGTVTGHASSTLSVNGSAAFTVETDGVAPNSGDAVKTFVDANIQITPQQATNPVGSNHVLTGHVNVNDGSGGGYVNAPDGTVIQFSLTNGAGATASFVGPSSCTTSGGTGSCQVTISSPTAGTTQIKATTDVLVGGVSLHRETGDGHPGDSADANKAWASARIRIAPDQTNEVGTPHTFTVTLEKDTGGGFGPAAGEHVDVTLTDANGAIHSLPTGTCTNAGANTNAAGQCQITFNSLTAGTVTGHATSTLDFGGGAVVTVETDGIAPNSGDAVKTYVDMNIQITPNGVNRVGDTHHFTAHVNVNSGNGAGFVNAPDGTQITFAINSGPGGFTSTNPCTVAGGTGSCGIDLVSNTAGVTVVKATSTATLAGLPVTRTTNGAGANSPPAEKTWVNAKISIAPNATNEVGQPHTFTVTLEKDTGSGFGPAAGEHVDVTLTNGNGATHTAPTGTCTNAGANTDANGQCTITFTSPTAGTVTGHAISTIVFSPTTSITVETDGVAPNSGDAVKTFVDANIQISPNGTNPVGATHTFTAHVNVDAGDDAFVNAPNGTQISFTIDSGPGSFTTANPCTVASGGSCDISLVSNTPGTTIVSAHVTLSVGGVSLTRHTDGSGANSNPATKLWAGATARTDIHNSAHQIVTNVTSGTVVHDKVFVTKATGTPDSVPAPTGDVIFSRYPNASCTGTPAATETVALGQDGTAETGPFTATADMSYRAEYQGDEVYAKALGACEPLTVTTITTTTTTTTTPPPPPPTIDLAVTKSDSPDPVTLGGNVTYTMVVRNNGPSVATGVKVADPVPANTTFVSVTTTKGTCTGSAAIVNCDLGTMAVGEQITITLIVKPTQAVTINNCVTVVGNETETNTANNQACAPTTVNTPFKPPVVKPKVCNRVTAAPKQLTATKLSTLKLLVTHSRNPVKGAKVTVKGAGVSKVSNKTNKQGRVNMKVKPARPGIMLVSTPGGKGCGDRVGVIPIFKPPVTG